MLRLVVPLALLLCACSKGAAPEASDAQASPQASAQPAPIATPLVASAHASPEGGPPPTPMRGDVAIDPEGAGKDMTGYSIAVVVRLPDAPAVPVGPAINAGAIDAMRKQNEPRFAIDLTPSRMRMQLSSLGFLLARNSELRARSDRYGHLFFAPDLASYRVLAPGSLRALFGERRADVSPLSHAEVTPRGDGARRLGYRTRRVEVQSRAGKGVFGIVKLQDLGDGGALVIRALLDLMNAAPQTTVVGPDEMPVHAELQWPSRGAIFFDVTAITKRTDLAAVALAVPPQAATFTTGPLPPVVGELRVDPKDLLDAHGADRPRPASRERDDGLAHPRECTRHAALRVDRRRARRVGRARKPHRARLPPARSLSARVAVVPRRRRRPREDRDRARVRPTPRRG